MSLRNWVLVPALLWATAGLAQSAHADIVNAQGQKIGTAEIRPSGGGVRIDVERFAIAARYTRHSHSQRWQM